MDEQVHDELIEYEIDALSEEIEAVKRRMADLAWQVDQHTQRREKLLATGTPAAIAARRSRWMRKPLELLSVTNEESIGSRCNKERPMSIVGRLI